MKLKGTIMKSLWPLITLLLVSLMQVMPGKTIIDIEFKILTSCSVHFLTNEHIRFSKKNFEIQD